MKKKCYICLSMVLWIMAFLLVMNGIRRKDEALASRIAPAVLRFHVLANSDSAADQALKLEVKDLLLEKIRDGVSAEDEPSRELIMAYVRSHKEELEQAAVSCMADRGFAYGADIRLEQCPFPEKTYGDMTFPAGAYDAVRVIIGEGKGQNFWCVLYPSLCYLDTTHAVVPDESKDQLKALIAEDDFSSLMQARRPDRAKKTEQESLPPRIQIRFKLADLFKNTL